MKSKMPRANRRASPVAQQQRICLLMHEMQEMPVRSLCRKDPLGEEMATHSNILPWTTPQAEEPSRLQSVGSQKVGQDWKTEHAHQHHFKTIPEPEKHLFKYKNYAITSQLWQFLGSQEFAVFSSQWRPPSSQKGCGQEEIW